MLNDNVYQDCPKEKRKEEGGGRREEGGKKRSRGAPPGINDVCPLKIKSTKKYSSRAVFPYVSDTRGDAYSYATYARL